tara:strand:+ start:1409 stop:1693 length:285 start_codon:yes stop_codon:yes gene_type:complete
MASITISREHSALLDRTAKALGKRIGRAVSRKEVLAAVLDIAANDEKAYDPVAPLRAVSPLRREAMQVERASRTTSYDIDMLFSALRLTGDTSG